MIKPIPSVSMNLLPSQTASIFSNKSFFSTIDLWTKTSNISGSINLSAPLAKRLLVAASVSLNQ